MSRSRVLLALSLLAAAAAGRFGIETILPLYGGLEVLAAFATGRAKLGSIPRVAWFLADFAWDIARSNVAMAFDAATPRDWHRVRLARVPIDDLSEREIALLNHRINLSPGTLVCEIDAENGHLVVHDMYGGGGADRGARLRRPIDILRKGRAAP